MIRAIHGEASGEYTLLIAGTIPYISPEQACGKRQSEASDWRSAGRHALSGIRRTLPICCMYGVTILGKRFIKSRLTMISDEGKGREVAKKQPLRGGDHLRLAAAGCRQNPGRCAPRGSGRGLWLGIIRWALASCGLSRLRFSPSLIPSPGRDGFLPQAH